MGTSTSREHYKIRADGGRRPHSALGRPVGRHASAPSTAPSLASSRTAATSVKTRTTIMSSKRNRHVRERILLEKKVRSLGRVFMSGFTAPSMERFRAHIRREKGDKTKLRLTVDGLGSGYNTGSVFRNRMPAEFIPMKNIYDMFTDQRYTNVLLCVQKHSESAYEVWSYRFQEPMEAMLFQKSYQDLTGKTRIDHTDSNPITYNGDGGRPEPITLVGSANGTNWALKSATLDRRNHETFLNDDSYGDGTLRSARSNATLTHRHQNGAPGRPLHLDDAINRRVSNSSEFHQWASHRDAGMSPSPDYDTGTANTDTMKREIEQLTEEVRTLKTRLHSRGVLSDEVEQDTRTRLPRTPIVIRAQPELVRSKSSDFLATTATTSRALSDSSSDSGVISRGDADLVDQGVGTVKARAGDYRPNEVRHHGNQPETFTVRARSASSGRAFDDGASSIVVPVTRAGQTRGTAREEISHRRNYAYDVDTVDRGRRRRDSNSSSPPRASSRASRTVVRSPVTLTRSRSTESKFRGKMNRSMDQASEKEGSVYTVQLGPGGTYRRPRQMQKIFVPGTGQEYYVMSPGAGYRTLSTSRFMEPL